MNKYLKELILGAIITSIIIVFQMLAMPQYITGIIINLIYVVFTLVSGLRTTCYVAVLVPFIASITGILKPVLVPVIPIIILSNLIYVFSVYRIKGNNIFLRILFPPILKALTIFLGGKLFINFFEVHPMFQKMFIVFVSINLMTAFVGNIIGIFLSKRLIRSRT